MTTSLESELQQSILQILQKNGYQYLGSHLHVNGPELWDNFKTQFERLNKEELEGEELTPQEFERLKTLLPKNAREAYRVLREGIRLLLDSNRTITCQFYDDKNNENNVYQVAQEVRAEGSTISVRFDLILFINGVPFSNMELKNIRVNKGTQKAVSQINRYTAEGVYRKGLMRFTQYYSVSNGTTTQYFVVNPRADTGQLRTAPYGHHLFRWTDHNNKPTMNAERFAEDFYKPETTHKILTNYMLMLPEGKGIVILRPYQIYAVESSTKRVLEGNNSLVWHSTGSGKTLTSFVLAKTLIETTPNKVILLLDRNDLADQTMKEYRKFDITGTISSAIFKGRELHTALKDPQQKLVITTIQSYNKWTQRYSKTVTRLSNKPTTFVIDECHRSTFGDMFTRIRSGFPNSTFIGFTGTPIMEENVGESKATTAHLFGDPSHTYNIKNAIDDTNVLPFKIQKASHGQTLSETVELNKDYYRNPVRMQGNAHFIASNLHKHTNQQDLVKHSNTQGYTAMLATDGKPSAIFYWEKLTPLLKEQNRTTGIIYSVEENAEFMVDGQVIYEKNYYTRIMSAWDEVWGTKYSTHAKDSFEDMAKAYNNDVIAKAKEGKIDLLIVSDMLLTGFDAPMMNTLYLDKNLKYHTLLQAMSRTNRICDAEKRVGNIVVFDDRDMNDDINESITLYSGGHPVTDVLDRDSYMEVLAQLKEAVPALRTQASSAGDILDMYQLEELWGVSSALSKVQKLLSVVKLYTEWDESHYAVIGISRQEIDMYYSCLQEARNKIAPDGDETDDKTKEALGEIDFYIHEAGYYIIDVAYITNLLHSFIEAPPEAKQRWIEETEQSLKATQNEEVKKTMEALEEALEACKRGEVHTVDDLLNTLGKEREKLHVRKVSRLSEKYKLPQKTFEDWVQFYQMTSRHSDDILPTLKTHASGLKYKERSLLKRHIQESIQSSF